MVNSAPPCGRFAATREPPNSRMMPAEIRKWCSVDNRALRRTKGILKNGMAIGTSNGVHRIKLNAKTRLEKRFDRVKVE